MHLHTHPAKGNLTPGKKWDTPRGLEPHWHSIQCGARSTSVMRSQSSAIQGDVKSASDLWVAWSQLVVGVPWFLSTWTASSTLWQLVENKGGGMWEWCRGWECASKYSDCTNRSIWTAMHLHAHPAKGKDEYSSRSWTPLALDTGWCQGNFSDMKSTECNPRWCEVSLRSMSGTKPARDGACFDSWVLEWWVQHCGSLKRTREGGAGTTLRLTVWTSSHQAECGQRDASPMTLKIHPHWWHLTFPTLVTQSRQVRQALDLD